MTVRLLFANGPSPETNTNPMTVRLLFANGHEPKFADGHEPKFADGHETKSNDGHETKSNDGHETKSNDKARASMTAGGITDLKNIRIIIKCYVSFFCSLLQAKGVLVVVPPHHPP